MKLLIADDDPVFRTLLSGAAERWGYEPVLATDGDDALRLLSDPDGPRLALLDWVMPGVDGLEICRRLRAPAFPRYVYVVLLTARTASADLVAGLEAGADEFVSKPVNLAQLRLRVAAGARIVALDSRQFACREGTELLVGNLRRISARLFHTQEEERRMIARELHEGVAQSLTAVLLRLGLGAAQTEVSSATQEVLARVRMLAYQLYPLLLDEIGLTAALRHYSEAVWPDAANEIELRVPAGLAGLSAAVEVAVFRIAQEGVETLRKLCGSGRTAIELRSDRGEMRLTVRGLSAAPPDLDLGAIGILAMRERAEQLGGSLTVAQEGGALAISAVLPGRAYAAAAE